MDLVTAATVGGLLWKFFVEGSGSNGKRLEPVKFSAIDVEQFTSVETANSPGSLTPTRTRRFDRDIGLGIFKALRGRSARAVQIPELAGMAVHTYEIVPAEMGMPVAAEVVEQATGQGMVALGSLSFLLINSGRQVPMLLVIGGPGTEQLAVAGTGPDGGPAAQFARLYPPEAAPVVETSGEAVADTTPAPAPAPGANGVAKHEPNHAEQPSAAQPTEK